MLAAQRLAAFNRTRTTLVIDAYNLRASRPDRPPQSLTYDSDGTFLVAEDPAGKHWVLFRAAENRLLSSGKTFVRAAD